MNETTRHPPAHRLASILSLAKASGAAAVPEELDLSDPAQSDFGAYVLLERIGAGGMGLVYRARQKTLDRDVAIKVLNASWAMDLQAGDRLREEARRAAGLYHPNILPVLEIGQHAGVPYIAMPLARGETLATRIARARLTEAQTVHLMIKIVDAIHYAHRLGLLHLDLKPANVLFDEHGEPLIADFGLARPMDANGEVIAQEVSGTPGFMAPEQVLIKEFRLSVATDVYALGAMLYQLLCGSSPHGEGPVREVLQRALAGQIPALSPQRVSADLIAIVEKCLALRAADRYAHAGDLLDDLRRCRDRLPVSVRRARWPERLRRFAEREPALALSGLSLILLGLVSSILATAYWQVAERARNGNAAVVTMMLNDELQKPKSPLVPSRPDEIVPIAPCFGEACVVDVQARLAGVLNHLGANHRIDRQALLAELQRTKTADEAQERAKQQVIKRLRDGDARRIDADMANALSQSRASGAALIAMLLSAPAMELLSEGFDAYAFDAGGPGPDARALFKRATTEADRDWQRFALAHFCSTGSSQCRALRTQMRNDLAGNAAIHLTTLIETGPDVMPGFSEEKDQALLNAASTPHFRQYFPEALPDLLLAAQQTLARAGDHSELNAHDLSFLYWLTLSNQGDVLVATADYCQRSFIKRRRADLEQACRRVFELAAGPDHGSVMGRGKALCEWLHYLPTAAEREPVLAEYRRIAWLRHARDFQESARSGATWYRETLKAGSIGHAEYLLTQAHLPLTPPDNFVSVLPLSWWTEAGERREFSELGGEGEFIWSSHC